MWLRSFHPVCMRPASCLKARAVEQAFQHQVSTRMCMQVWWLCKEHAEPCSWQAAPDTRTGPLQTGCPTCAINTRRAALMRKPGRMQLAVPVQA